MLRKLTATAILATSLAHPAWADGPQAGLDDPRVIAPAAPSWAGAYAGASLGMTKTTRTFTTSSIITVPQPDIEVSDGGYVEYTRECMPSGLRSAALRNICIVGVDAYGNSPEISSLAGVTKLSYRNNGSEVYVDGDDPVRFIREDEPGYSIWLNENKFRYTTTDATEPNRFRGTGAMNTLISQRVVETFKTVSQPAIFEEGSNTITETTSDGFFGVFAGYGVEGYGLVGRAELGARRSFEGQNGFTGELQVGFPVGDALFYVGAGKGSIGGDSMSLKSIGVDIQTSASFDIGAEISRFDFDNGKSADDFSVRIFRRF